MFDIEFALRNISYLKAHITGSSFICDPPVLNTDIDIVVLANPHTLIDLINDEWEMGEPYGGSQSFRKHLYNVILITSRDKFWKLVGATYAAKALNLQHKQYRIDLFESMINNSLLPIGGPF